VSEAESAKPSRRQVAYLQGRWRVTYLWSDESGREARPRSGVITGPLVSEQADPAIRVAVMPDDGMKRILIRRDSITSIAPLRSSRVNTS
jgi:hypothetical protein